MRKWKLKKDTPTIKAGTIFQEVTSDYDKSRELVRIMPTSGTTSPQWTIDDIHSFDEWFEEVKEFEEWKPKDREQYLYIGPLGRPCIDTWRDTGRDEHRLSVGNCYPVNTPDRVIIKEHKLIPQAMHRLKMAAKKAWFEFDGSEGPDWSNPVHPQWLIHYYRRSGEIFAVKGTPQIQTGMPSFPTERSCRAYIDNNPEDMKLLFGVE